MSVLESRRDARPTRARGGRMNGRGDVQSTGGRMSLDNNRASHQANFHLSKTALLLALFGAIGLALAQLL